MPAATGVSKYLAIKKATQEASPKTAPVKKVEPVLEGQLILAGEELPATGVEKYLENQQAIAAAEKQAVTGVAKYMVKQSKRGKKRRTTKAAGKLTSVEQYMRKQA